MTGLTTRVRQLLRSTAIVYECRNCGTTLDSNETECPNCGSTDTVCYKLK